VGGPQQGRQRITFVRLTGDKEIGKQSPLLAPGQHDRQAIPGKVRRAKQIKAALFHAAPSTAGQRRYPRLNFIQPQRVVLAASVCLPISIIDL
jgi:hypothetical protein